MTDMPPEKTPIAKGTDFMASASPEELLSFCLAPGRTWSVSAQKAVAAAVADREDDPDAVGAAFAGVDAEIDERTRERVEAIATFFGASLGAQTPPAVVEWLDFGSKYRNDVLAKAWEAFLSARDPASIREQILQDPKGRVALFRYAYDPELFRNALRDPDWKGWVGALGEDALPEICASLEEDEHPLKRRRMTVESAVQILGRGSGPVEGEERAVWDTVSTHWRAVMKELDLIVDTWPNGTLEVLARLDPESATGWLDAWEESDLHLPARIRVFPFLAEDRQWRVIEELATKKRRSKETGDLRRAVDRLPEPVAHVAELAKKYDATDEQLELLRKVFKKRKTEFEQAMQG